ncbi:MAG: lipopolysaccharide biosynthesis protein RfbH [Nitrospirae bacterium]|nr:lipopolysaccharide biosynthesis protein RfbH [Candidatus Troglogloeales bacterium]
MNEPVEPGNIYIYNVPFVDSSKAKPRPVLVTSLPSSKGDVMGVPGTTQIENWNETHQIVIRPEDITEGTLSKTSVFPVSKQMVFSPRFFAAKVGTVKPAVLKTMLRQLTCYQVEQYCHAISTKESFTPGETIIPAAGKVIGTSERTNMVEAVLDGHLTTGRFNDAFEKRLAGFLGMRHVLTTNSGSSANLLAVSALTSPWLGAERLQPGDEVITVAAGFPTTVNPILQNGLVPVFVDVTLPTYNVDVTQLEAAYSSKTRAVILAHTLGNPFNPDAVTNFVRQHDLWLIEDCCDALGSTYKERLVGTFGDIGTISFYPAHHITMGEGGAVFTNNSKLDSIIESFRDWGRDCWCDPGKENTCGKRFGWQLGSLPLGYDHKFTYSHMGYNLKISDTQAACGLAQMDRLPGFIQARKRNFAYLKIRLKSCEKFLILPEATPGSDPSWFGFPVTIREEVNFSRVDLLKCLDQHKIGTRLLFAGNLTRQPYFEGRTYRISGELKNTDKIMNNAFWIGVYPGLTEEMLDYAASRMETFFGVSR